METKLGKLTMTGFDASGECVGAMNISDPAEALSSVKMLRNLMAQTLATVGEGSSDEIDALSGDPCVVQEYLEVLIPRNDRLTKVASEFVSERVNADKCMAALTILFDEHGAMSMVATNIPAGTDVQRVYGSLCSQFATLIENIIAAHIEKVDAASSTEQASPEKPAYATVEVDVTAIEKELADKEGADAGSAEEV